MACSEPQGIQVYRGAAAVVHAADVHYQPAVDKHPNVVVAQKFKVLARHVLELGLHLHGHAVVVVCPVAALAAAVNARKAAGDGIVIGVRDCLFVVQELEVVYEEHASAGVACGFAGVAVHLGAPNAVVVEYKGHVAACGVGVAPAVFDGEGFGNKPAVQILGIFALAFPVKTLVADGHAVWPQSGQDHAVDYRLAIVIAAAGLVAIAALGALGRGIGPAQVIVVAAKVTADAVAAARCGAAQFCGAGLGVVFFGVAVRAVVPVEHHHGQVFYGAVPQYTRVGRTEFGGVGLERANPNGIAFGEDAVDGDFVVDGNGGFLDAHHAVILVADGLLKIKHGGLFECDVRLEPPAIIVDLLHDGGGIAVHVNNGGRVGPWCHEKYGLAFPGCRRGLVVVVSPWLSLQACCEGKPEGKPHG